MEGKGHMEKMFADRNSNPTTPKGSFIFPVVPGHPEFNPKYSHNGDRPPAAQPKGGKHGLRKHKHSNGREYVVHKGPRGGEYIQVGGYKVYI